MAVYKTPQADQDYDRIIEESARRYGRKTAKETARQLQEVDDMLAKNPDAGKLDPEHHSDRFKYIRIENRQKVIVERYGNDAIIVMADYDSRDWKTILKDMEPFINKQIDDLSRKHNLHHKYDAGAALKRIEADQKHAPQSPDRGDPSDRSDRD